jgi:hypothetical protein
MKKLLLLIGLLFSTTHAIADNNANCTNSQDCYNSGVYIYEGGQDLVDLYGNHIATSYNLNTSDDSMSNQVSLGMEWNRWGQTWSHARMSTNGCVNLMSGSAGGSSSSCHDYTPQSLPYQDYTLYPFWTDLIRGNANQTDGQHASKMLFKDFGDYVVFGWYYMREYKRNSSNSFEAILYENNSFEYRYRELDIIQHDVLIGEQGHHSTTPADTKTYLFYNDGQSGYDTLDAYLANSNWPDLENGGSLYGGTEAQMCEIDALYASTCTGYAAAYLAQQCAISALHSSSCSGYAAAYLTQQCDISTLYSEECTGYAAALLIYECDIDVFYATSCSGYASALAMEQALEDSMYTDEDQYGYDDGYDEYGNEESQYGYDDDGNAYTEEDMWYDAEYDEYLDPNDPCYQNACENFTDADWYALDVEQFGQENVDEWYGSEVEFTEDGYIDYGSSTEEEYWSEIDEGMDTYDAEQEAIWIAEEEAWQLEEEQRMLADAEMLAQEEEYWAQEEAFYATMETDADWYEYEVEEFGQEQVDEWWGEDVEFSEEGFVEEAYWEELYSEEFFEEELYTQEEELLAQNLTDQEIYILEEEIGVEIFVEEEWEPVEENEIYEEELEDFEREAIEELEEEVYEEFEEEYDEEELYLEEDEAFEDLIDEDELEELINEEDEEEFFKEEQVEENQSRILIASTTSQGPSVSNTEQSFTVMIAQQEQQEEQQTIQQAVSQDSSSSSSQAVVAEIDFGGTQEEQVTVAEVLQEQLDDGSGSTTGGSFDANSYSSGSSSNSGSVVATSSQQEQITQSTGNTFVVEQQEQSTGQVQIQVAEIVDSGPAVTAFEVAEQQQETQDEQQELTFDDGSNFTVADQNFESSFDDALGTGQSIGQFLSNTTPDFAKFEVEAPTFQEQRQSAAVESLADSVSSTVIQANLQTELNKLQQGNENTSDYGDQTVVVAYIGYTAGFSEYTSQTQLADQQSWYDSSQVYKGQKTVDNKASFYMMAGKTQEKLQKMVLMQYGINPD